MSFSYANFYDPAIEAGKVALIGGNVLSFPLSISNVINTRKNRKLAQSLEEMQAQKDLLRQQVGIQRNNILKNIGLSSTLGAAAGLGIGYNGDRFNSNQSEYSSMQYMASFNFDTSPLIGAGEAGLGAWIVGGRLSKARQLRQNKQLLEEAINQQKLDNANLQAQPIFEKLIGNKFILPAATIASVQGGRMLGDKLQSDKSSFSKYTSASYGDSKKPRDWSKSKKYNTAYQDKGLKVR